METKAPIARRSRDSNVPVPGREKLLKDEDLTDLHHGILAELEPSLGFQFLTTAWLHYFAGGKNAIRTVKRCGLMRENDYIDVPEMWHSSPNTSYKHYVYQLRDKGTRMNAGRGVPALNTPRRSNSYYHECNIDNGFYAPLRYFVDQNPSFKLVRAADLLRHPEVPAATRNNSDPFGWPLRGGKIRRFDGTPFVLQRNKSICIPGIEHDRNTEGNTSDDVGRTTIGSHIAECYEYLTRRYYQKQYNFDNCFIPILLADRRYDRTAEKNIRIQRVMTWFEKQFGPSPHFLFKQIPDLSMLRHFPEPRHYDPSWKPETVPGTGKPEWQPPNSIHVFTTPWRRVGHPDFSFAAFDG